MKNQKNIDEIKSVLDRHEFKINTIISEIMIKFNFKTLCHKSGMVKQSGYNITEVITLMILLPLMLLNSTNALCKKYHDSITTMKKDVFYRLKNNEKMPWRSLLYAVSKKFVKLVNDNENNTSKFTAFIIDDTIDSRVGKNLENISYVHDHVKSRNSSTLGYKNLMLAFFDGKSTIPLDFSLHSEKKQKKKYLKKQFSKKREKHTNGYKRIQESKDKKTDNALKMIKRAVKQGFLPNYVLMDSWFPSKEVIETIRTIKEGAMHVICGMKRDKRKYKYKGESLNASNLIKKLKTESKEKRCRKWNIRYYEVLVTYEGIGEVKLYFCRFPYQKKWRLFLSTDTSLSLVEMMEIYSCRWTIEVMFKELKQYLQLGKCQSRDFDAQIASVTISLVLYIFLSYSKRTTEYTSLYGIYEEFRDELYVKTVAERLWELFDELLEVIITQISEHGVVDILVFKNTEEYKYVKELFEQSFLRNQIDKVA